MADLISDSLPRKQLMDLDPAERVYFLRALRAARYAALEDAENFTSTCFVLEELGAKFYVPRGRASPVPNGLGPLIPGLVALVPDERQSRFGSDLRRLKDVRNDKSHRGVYARNAVTKAVAVSALLEELLMELTTTVADIMVGGVTYAEPFMTLAKVRELLLSHSFSYLPYRQGEEYVLLSDVAVAQSWHTVGKKVRQLNPLSHLIAEQKLSTIPGTYLPATTLLTSDSVPSYPCLVQDPTGNIIGIVSAFDWL
ncbi:hypothetical protein [Deinococcus sp. QL22]|uniref:hypothetical protein n=1 Tax=Deinococcus sp. QL22 TaxID=2939437 RepID=UPI0020170D3A|nr:hypothetical protein [Deinococcus sp. QL22]UQN08435.1 hypothetical protein M1R55_17090 [Deinococcus sp. QL22]